jgi:S-adenosylmethionine synthetase
VLTAIAASIYERWPYDGKYIINSHHPKVRLSDLPEYDIIQKKRERHRNINDELFEIDSKHAESMKPFNKKEQNHWDKLVAEAQDIYKYIKAKCKKAEELAESQWEHDITICQSHLADDEQSGIVDLIRNGYQLDGDLTISPLGPWTGGINVDCGAVNRKLGSDMGEGVSGGGINGKDLSKGDVSINIVCFLKAVQSGQTVTACCSIGDEHVTFQYASGKTETETFADVVEMARLYILTDCNGSFETFSEWGLIRPKP